MSCKNCSPLCFEPVTDQCVTYTGPSNHAMGIEQNESMSSAMTKLIAFTQKIYDKLNECNPCAQNGFLTSSLNVSGNSETVVSLPMQLTSSPKETNIDITYNASNLPAGHELVYANVRLDGVKNGYSSILSENNQLIGGFTLQPNNFPATLNTTIKTISADGEHMFQFASEVSPISTDYNIDIISSRNTTTEIVDQSSVNTLLNNRLNTLDQKFNVANSITSSNIPGSTTPETIVYLMNKVQELDGRIPS